MTKETVTEALERIAERKGCEIDEVWPEDVYFELAEEESK